MTPAVCDDAATLLFLADQACVTPHGRLSRTDRAAGPDHPDRLVSDLDPPDDDFAPVRAAAAVLRTLLDELALPAAPMTTGSRGPHLAVPLDGRQGLDEARRTDRRGPPRGPRPPGRPRRRARRPAAAGGPRTPDRGRPEGLATG